MSPRRILTWLGWFLLSVFVLFVLLPAALLFGWYEYWEWTWVGKSLPANIRTTGVITSDHASGFMEGCQLAVYKLAPETVEGLDQRGLDYLGKIMQPPLNNKRNPFSGWQPTPAPGKLYAYRASAGCQRGFDSMHEYDDSQIPIDIDEAAKKPGGFYSHTQNDEGMILLLPKQGLAIYLYDG